MGFPVAALLLPFVLAASPAAAGGIESMGRELARAAKDAGLARVAVMGLEPAGRQSTFEAWNLTEQLLTGLANAGKVQVVERSLLGKVMDEHRMAATGMVDAAALKKLGKVLPVDGVVTGSFVTHGNTMVVRARLIDVETAVVVAASERRIEREVFDARDEAAAVAAQAKTDCSAAARRVDRLESDILDLKARRWALEFKKGAGLSELGSDPVAIVSDASLRRVFYDKVMDWLARERVPELTGDEVRRLVTLDQEAFALHGECGT
ncbi:MAG: FlgO family outer membrane protein [Elusimicrobia bacterium]|nr:FlgO family outer membrane protein [Elusimicrobiota bacterium]